MTALSKMRTKTIALFVTIGTAASLLMSPAGRADSEISPTVLTETILSLDKARNKVLEEHFRSSGDAAPGYSREDALLFVAYLDGRINYYCHTLYQSGGAPSLDGLPCGASGQGGPGGPRFDSAPVYSGQTSQEKVASLDQELTTTLGEFDDMLLKEQERAAAHIPRQRESGSTGQYGQPAGIEQGDTDAEGGEAAKQPPGGKTGQSGAGDPEGDMEQGRPTEGAGGGATDSSRPPPAQGSKELSEADDDVVARQLREAAEQETDPEVKEKLWEEYRKYKEGIK